MLNENYPHLVLTDGQLGSIRCKQNVGWQHIAPIKDGLFCQVEIVFIFKMPQATFRTSAVLSSTS